MNRRTRVAGALAAAVLAAAPLEARSIADTRPPCVHALVAILDDLDSASAQPGQVFEFRLVENAVAPDGTPLQAGQLGYGVIANASHANKGGQPGYLALETRFFALGDGRHIPVIIDRHNDDSSVATGATANAPWALGLLPIVGYAAGGYDALHHGRDAAILRGTRISVLIGDQAALGTCRLPAAGETPAPGTVAPAAAPPAPAAAAPATAGPGGGVTPAPATAGGGSPSVAPVTPAPAPPAAPPATPTQSPTTTAPAGPPTPPPAR
jgi:hypothetical protein